MLSTCAKGLDYLTRTSPRGNIAIAELVYFAKPYRKKNHGGEPTMKRSIVSVCLSLEFGGIVLYLDCLLVLAFSFIRAMQSPCIQSYDCCIKLQVAQ